MTRLEVASHCAIIVVCLVASGILLEHRFATSSASGPAKDSVVVGTRLSQPGYSWGRAKKTVVAIVSTQCPYCEESMPFYRKLADFSQRSQSERPVPFIVVSPEPVATVESYFSGQMVKPSSVLQADLRKMGIARTPTLLAVDSNGTVTKVLTGFLSEDREKEALEALSQE